MQSSAVEEAYQKGFELRHEGKYREAKAFFQQALTSDPGHWQSKWQLGLIQGFEGDFDGSLESLGNLASQYPHNTQILYDLAMTQMMLGYNDEACANFQRILELEPGHENAQRQLKFF
ncbi:MAG: tetratricopeptide repeat protein [Armatimonadetes bacterium]|nr:tetratricopeptide repeat protein [Armatimonadota bacterium]